MSEVKETTFTLTVPLDHEQSKSVSFEIKDMSVEVFMAAQDFFNKKKELDGIIMIIKALKVSGDDPEILRKNFVAFNSASNQLKKLLEPVGGELKKN